ncbi:MAG: hypothetical protein IKU88_05510 [Alistipes sp.]|nr:hypothetical protein [Alistipes sp.]
MDQNKTLDYQFTAVPTQLMVLLDVNCRSMLFTLCQLSSYYADENGKFFRTNADLSEESRLSQKLVIATIDTLYSHGIINVWSVGKSNGKHSNYFKLNISRFKEFERLSMDELKNPEYQIEMVNYRAKGYTPSYLESNDVIVITPPITDTPPISLQDSSFPLPERTTSTITEIIPISSQITNNIDNIENTNNKENTDIEDTIKTIDNKSSILLPIENIDEIKERFETYKEVIIDKLCNGVPFETVMEDLAREDWEVYEYNKLFLRSVRFQFYKDNKDCFKRINKKYAPSDENLQVY